MKKTIGLILVLGSMFFGGLGAELGGGATAVILFLTSLILGLILFISSFPSGSEEQIERKRTKVSKNKTKRVHNEGLSEKDIISRPKSAHYSYNLSNRASIVFPELIPYHKEKSWTLYNSRRSKFIDCKFDKVAYLDPKLRNVACVVTKDKRVALVTSENDLDNLSWYDRLTPLKSNSQVIIAERNGQLSLINSQNQKLIASEYKDIFEFPDSGTLYSNLIVLESSKYGLINTADISQTLPCIYEDITKKSENLFTIVLNEKTGLFDSNASSIIIPCSFDKIASINDGVASLKMGDTWWYLDLQTNSYINKISFDALKEFSGEFGLGKRGSKHVMIFRNGSEKPIPFVGSELERSGNILWGTNKIDDIEYAFFYHQDVFRCKIDLSQLRPCRIDVEDDQYIDFIHSRGKYIVPVWTWKASYSLDGVKLERQERISKSRSTKRIQSSEPDNFIKITDTQWQVHNEKIWHKDRLVFKGSNEYDTIDVLGFYNGLAFVEVIEDVDPEFGSIYGYTLGYIDINGKHYWDQDSVDQAGFGEEDPQSSATTPEISNEAQVSSIEDHSDIAPESLYTNYDSDYPTSNDSYPMIQVPGNNCIVRSYRKGRAKRRGFKEESFEYSIARVFSAYFNVYGDLRINTSSLSRPFEPDISLIGKSNRNLRIDIEIDEPYAGITRQPTHCIGDDVHRDVYFTERGWLVIRFTERQVHLNEIGCLKVISDVISTLDNSFIIPSELSDCNCVAPESLWDILQAQKWEKENYRENYLNHSFGIVPTTQEVVQRELNNKEIEEERHVVSSRTNNPDTPPLLRYNNTNSHPRDLRICFFPQDHLYTVDNVPMPSVTSVIDKFFPKFDSAYWSEVKASERGTTSNVILNEWEQNGLDARTKGTDLHEHIEQYFLKNETFESEEFKLFEKFFNEHNYLSPYRTEWRVFDDAINLAGTIDMIVDSGEGFHIYDWKRSKKIISPNGGVLNNHWQHAIGKLSHLEDTSFNRYALQQSLYWYILDNNYNVEVTKSFLVVLHPNYEDYYKIEAPYLREEIEFIVSTL